jgi:hypothetical protein
VPAQADVIPYNHTAVITPEKRVIAENLIRVRMAYLPIVEQKIEDPADPETEYPSFVANCNNLFTVNAGLFMVNDKAAEFCCYLLRI